MGKLIIHESLVTNENRQQLIDVCPFGAIVEKNGRPEITAACKMCKLCTKKGPKGVMEYVEDEAPAVDKDAWRGIAVFVDHAGDRVHRVTYELLGKARELAAVTGHPVYALLIGSGTEACAEKLRHYGADKVFVYDDEAFAHFRIEPYTAAFYDFITRVRPSSVLVGATDLGRQLTPRVAARCRTGLTADCTVLRMKENTDLVQIRPAFGGNIMAQIVSPRHRPQFCTVRYKIFTEPKPSETPSGETVFMNVTDAMRQSAIELISSVTKPTDVDISEAEVIVAVGRGAASEQALAMARELASLLGGVLACSRPLVEGNVLDAKHQIGLSGRTVKPKLILTLGISGSVQFAAGMKSSDVIVAVNSDKDAPIFDIAHYVVVGDVNEILPQLFERVKEAKRDVQ